jgi:predicted metal-dependent hydrolase|tara:strand:- start:563 stop:1513 length:951 start_codon:yes stop_codon:yes gene_type:complete
MPADAQPKVETQESADAKMIDLPSDGPSVDVEIPEAKETEVVSQPQQEQEVVVEESASQGEMDDYGKKVQSRIDKLTKKLRESERREQAAIEFAQGLQSEQTKLQQRAKLLDTGYVNEFASRVEAQTAEAKKQLKDAMDTGDIDAQVEAQQKIARLAVDADRAKKSLDQRERLKKEMEARGVDPNQPQMPQQAQQPAQQQPAAPPDPKAEAWAEKNEWFGTDEPMTLTSFSIHRKLVEEGFDTKSDEYYSEIDKRMRDTFPHKFEQVSTPTQTVAPATRSTQPAKRKGSVRLTPSQVAIAKKLGVPLSEYAKYVKE